MTTVVERFRTEQDKLLRAAGLAPREIRESSGKLAPCDATRATETHAVGCLLLLGDPGTGKSAAAARWILSEGMAPRSWGGSGEGDDFAWVYKGGPLLWKTARSLARVRQYEEAEMEILFRPARLVIDDIGMEYLDAKGFLVSLIDEIVHERHRRELPTVMTANLSPKDFLERYGRRVVDRIAEYQEPVLCIGDSFRTSPPRQAQLQLPALATDADVIARHAEILTEREARDRAYREQLDRTFRERNERDARAAEGRQVLAARLAADKAATKRETPQEIADREGAARAEIARKLAERASTGSGE